MKFIYRHYMKLIAGIILALLIIIPSASYYIFIHSSSSGVSKDIQVKIHKGSTSEQIINELYNRGLIKSKVFSKLYLKLHSYGSDLKSGVYMFNTKMQPDKIFNMLREHLTDPNYVKFTIPEGYNIKQIEKKMMNTGLINDPQQFIDCINNDKFDFDFISNIPQDRTYRLEGYIFPATYEFEKGMTVHYMINKMLERFSYFYQNIKSKLVDKNISLDKTLIIASMIESEAKTDKDRSLISAVIYNRLNTDMKLQIDATVQYALGFHKSRIYYKDLNVDSKYNTYKYPGLPKGPISSPGEKSVLAAIEPADVNYLFYIAKKDGTHYFTKDYKNFLKMKSALRK